VGIRKISANGKSSHRFVRCITVTAGEWDSGAGSTEDGNTSWCGSEGGGSTTWSNRLRRKGGRNRRDRNVDLLQPETNANTSAHFLPPHQQTSRNRVRVLVWGNKNKARVRVDRFIKISVGKTTPRTRKSQCAGTRLLSLIHGDPAYPSLDIETPTKEDRDKFVMAFSRFLGVPVEDETGVVYGGGNTSVPEMDILADSEMPVGAKADCEVTALCKLDDVGHAAASQDDIKVTTRLKSDDIGVNDAGNLDVKSKDKNRQEMQLFAETNAPPLWEKKPPKVRSTRPSTKEEKKDTNPVHLMGDDGTPGPSPHASPDDRSDVSSLTNCYDLEIVEELHQTIGDLQRELAAARDEATRAVKVAEQAIQSAESCTSNDWNSTVTHKAVEAAAQA